MHDQLVGHELATRLLVSGNDAAHSRIGGGGAGSTSPHGVSDTQDVTVAVRREVDHIRAHVQQMPRLPHPRQHTDLRPAEPAEEDIGERGPLPIVPGSVDVEHDRPRRAGFVVVVAHDEDCGEAADVDISDAAVLTSHASAPKQMPFVDRPPATPSTIRHGQIASQLQLSKYDPPTE